MLPAMFRSLVVPFTTRVVSRPSALPVLNSVNTMLKWQVTFDLTEIKYSSKGTRYVPPPPGAEEGEDGKFKYSEIRGSRPALISGKYANPKKLKHRQSVGKRILHLQREANKMERERRIHSGINTQADLGIESGQGRHRATPRRIPTQEDIEFNVKRREVRRLMPFKKAANTKQWRMMSNNDKRVDDETIEALQRFKAEKQADPQAKPDPRPLE